MQFTGKNVKNPGLGTGHFRCGFSSKNSFALGFSFCYQLIKNVGVFLAILQTWKNFRMKNPSGIWPFPRPGFFKVRTRLGFGNFPGLCFYSSQNENCLKSKPKTHPCIQVISKAWVFWSRVRKWPNPRPWLFIVRNQLGFGNFPGLWFLQLIK